MRADLWHVAAEVADPPDRDWHPRPRYAPKCGACGRFVAKATVRVRGNVSTGEVVELGDCSRCGRQEVW